MAVLIDLPERYVGHFESARRLQTSSTRVPRAHSQAIVQMIVHTSFSMCKSTALIAVLCITRLQGSEPGL